MKFPAARPQTSDAFTSARALVGYLLSLSAVAHAVLAWSPDQRAWRVALHAVALAAAVLGGDLLASRFPALAGWTGGQRARVVAGIVYGVLVFVAPPMVALEPALAARQAALFAAFQPLALLLVQLGRSPLLVLQNALVLVVLATLRGGLVAAAAVVAFVGLLGPFLAFDHCARTLAAYPFSRGFLVRVALRRALALTAPVLVAIAVLLAVAPPPPSAETELVAPAPVATREIAAAYQVLVFLGILGGAGIYYAGRILFRGRSGPPPLLEVEAPRPVAEEVLEPEARATPADYAGPRGRIVRAYVWFLRQSARLAMRRRPHQTAREYQAQLREPAAPLAMLTDLFVSARYGPDEPREDEALAAERAASAVVAALRAPRR